jgi:hypothetical protein
MTPASIAFTWGIGDGGNSCITGDNLAGTWQFVAQESVIGPEQGGEGSTYSCFVLRVCCVPIGGG